MPLQKSEEPLAYKRVKKQDTNSAFTGQFIAPNWFSTFPHDYYYYLIT
jgi:hypothetical protein